MRRIYLLTFITFLFIIDYGYAQTTPKIHGRLQYDVEVMKRNTDTLWAVGNEFRRAQLSVSGALTSHFVYKVQLNFAHGKLGFRDVYLMYKNKKWGNIGLGAMVEPTGLARGTSSKYIAFAERPMLTNAMQNHSRGSGIHYARFSAIENYMIGLQAALTGKGSDSQGFLDKHWEKGMNFSTRVFAKIPLGDDNELLHVGLNYASRPPKEMKFRPGNHMGSKYTYLFPGGERRLITGTEAALIWKSMSLRAETKSQSVPSNTGANYRVDGFYATAGWLVTGDKYTYKHGGFSRIKPAHPVDKNGFGAWEILFRFSQMTFNNDVLNVNPGMPGKINNLSFGINWYPHAHVRLMYTYNLTNDGLPGGLRTHIVRFQMDF